MIGISKGQKPKWKNPRNAFFMIPPILMNPGQKFLQEISLTCHALVNVIRQTPNCKEDVSIAGEYILSYISAYHLN